MVTVGVATGVAVAVAEAVEVSPATGAAVPTVLPHADVKAIIPTRAATLAVRFNMVLVSVFKFIWLLSNRISVY
jgi:hypothetical protein